MISNHRRQYANHHLFFATLLVVASFLGPAHSLPAQENANAKNANREAANTEAKAAPFLRMLENQEAGSVVLQMAVRRFERTEKVGPAVTMFSAIHIGDQSFYEKLQKLLDEKDVVLFESVKPPGAGRPEHSLSASDSSELKIATTKMRMRLLAIAAMSFERQNKKLPADMRELLDSVSGKLELYSSLLAKDGWGNDFLYSLQPDTAPATSSENTSPKTRFEITSLGEDKAPGGEGAAADILHSAQKPISTRDIPKEGEQGIQADLAQALGLVFQLDAMKHDKPNWRNSDLSMDQVQERLAASGANGDELFKMLDGSSLQAGVLKLVLGLMKMMPSMQLPSKLMIMEVMSRADQMMGSVPGTQKLMEVILKDRNKVVIDDLAAIIEREPEVKQIGIIYGGAHMPDLALSLQKMGYKEVSVEWLDAITVLLPQNPAERKQLESMRNTIRRSMEQQLKQLQKRAANNRQ